MMPVHVNYPGTERPQTGTYYIVAREGLFMHVRNDWVDAVIPMKEFQALESVAAGAELKLPPINALVFAKAIAFFRKVFEVQQTEAAVLLHYSTEHGWELSVPKQSATYEHVNYDMTERLEGYRCFGTMHSHGDMGADHSFVDVEDEASFDGIHITLGTLQKYPTFSMSAEIVFRGARFMLLEEKIEGVRSVKVEKPNTHVRPWLLEDDVLSHLFSFDPNVLSDWEVPAEWLERVERKLRRPLRPVTDVHHDLDKLIDDGE
jgi:hypothetical protein